MSSIPAWWRSAVVYQIYPWSFQDSNGDGIGDLPGIISRLDYLNDGTSQSLGIDAIWLSPIYPSPMVDFGYDISDYCNVDQRFGTLADFDRLVQEAKRRRIRIIMDLVLNHTSSAHPWFQQARASRSAPTREWYYWADGKGWGRPPSNWNARFGGSSWTWDRLAKQYYLHSFLAEQPDLNWHSPSLRQAMWNVVQFWIDRGVDGFRLDAINWLGKNPSWPDNPRRFGWRGYTRQVHLHDRDQPLAHEVMQELRQRLSAHPEVVLVGEASADTPGGPVSFYGDGSNELHTVFDFRLLKSPWQANRFRTLIAAGEASVPAGGWPSIVFSNHDQSRHIDRYGAGGHAERRARAAAVLLFTLRGTPFLYYGEELGMRDGQLRYHELHDPYTKRYWPFRTGRDPARTPMQWEAAPHAGFTTGKPWLPVSNNASTLNVARHRQAPSSLLSLYRRLIRLRQERPALTEGTYRPVESSDRNCLAFLRQIEGTADASLLVAVNFASHPLTCRLSGVTVEGRLLLSTEEPVACRTVWTAGQLTLQPDEAVILSLRLS